MSVAKHRMAEKRALVSVKDRKENSCVRQGQKEEHLCPSRTEGRTSMSFKKGMENICVCQG